MSTYTLVSMSASREEYIGPTVNFASEQEGRYIAWMYLKPLQNARVDFDHTSWSSLHRLAVSK